MQKYILLLGVISVLNTSCSVDPEITPFNIPPNTPYNLEYPPNFGVPNLPADNPMTEAGVQLGRMLFYEEQLSGDNTMSCASCHQQASAFSDPKAVSIGIDGIAGGRSTMGIMNMAWERVFFWDGRAATLEEQALGPIQNPIELHESLENVVEKLQNTPIYPEYFKVVFGDSLVTSDRIAKAIAQFERSMVSYNSKFDKHLRGEASLTLQELRGLDLLSHPTPGSLRGGNCSDCHQGPLLGTSPSVIYKNNGVDAVVGDLGLEGITGNAFDKGKFKVPTLRNIALTAPYMHDGRFNTLEEVLDHYNDTTLFSHENVDLLILSGVNAPAGTSLGLTDQEKADIIAFLHTLTDSTFIQDERFSNPF